MNLRGRIYFAYLRMRGSAIPQWYDEYLRADSVERTDDAARTRLAGLLRHCRDMVPYYQEILRDLPDPGEDPEAVLRLMPVLTKDTIRERFEALKSRDLRSRRWWVNTSGGSTGVPAKFIQDDDSAARNLGLALAFSRWVAGHEVGDPEVRLWGDEREVLRGTVGWGKRACNALCQTSFLNAFSMTPDAMREFARVLQRTRPKLVVAYAQAAYEFARFLEEEGIRVPRGSAVITSAGTLHPFMRTAIERVFGCPVFNRYGSREVGLIAAERPGFQGMWVPPWNVWVEVVDDAGRVVPPGTDGEILVTSLVNEAMPLVRYRIGDRGALGPDRIRGGQILQRVLGRNVDAFRRRDGTLIDGEYFTHLLYFRDWVDKFQFVQTDYDEVVLRIVGRNCDPRNVQRELDQMASSTKAALGSSAVLRVEWVNDIPPASSGKYRYTISEVAPP